MLSLLLFLLITFILALVLTGFWIYLTRRWHLYAQVTHRSLHVSETPQSGGIAFMMSFFIGLGLYSTMNVVPVPVYLVFFLASLLIALVGLIDDIFTLDARWRLCCHALLVAFAMVCLGTVTQLPVGNSTLYLGYLAVPLTFLGLIWLVNLYNFMDGIDGLAGMEAIFVCLSAVLLMGPGFLQLKFLLLMLAMTTLGFLAWNWAPAKVFMGDIGSGFLGFCFAGFILLSVNQHALSIWVWIILLAVFWVDATVTLVMRAKNRERLAEAHNLHAYQQLSKRWGSHARVVMLLAGINVFWLFPCAWIAATYSLYAALIVLIAALPLVIFFIFQGAGKRTSDSTSLEGRQ